MNENTKKVVNGFIALTEEEKKAFIKKANEYINGDQSVKTNIRKSINESHTALDLGPLGGACPCCGR